MSLHDYHHKRRFDKTPEPKGMKQETSGALTFVIQKHQATQLHYDFRLELLGVLKSWAIPKGPSLNPDDKRLAVMVEDHPIDYASFEGIIPKGNYGAGTVMVWDKGVYSPIAFVERKQAQVMLEEQLQKGHVTFVLAGEKVQGEFALVKSRKSEEENAWLLIKARDEYASKKDVLKKDRSVLSNRSMEEIAKQAKEKNEVWYGKSKTLNIKNIPKGSMPKNVRPMLAQSSDEPFDREGWIFELKYDGYRTIAEVTNGNVKLYSRNKLSFNEKFVPVVESLKKFPGDVVLDGEAVVIDKEGLPHFQWLQDYPKSKQGELVYYVFDILYYNRHILSSLPLLKRKELLKQILPPLPHIQYADHITQTGIAMFAQAKKLGIEGIISKNASSTYKQGERTDDWVKIKTQKRQEVVIAGFTQPKGGRNFLGALIAGVYKHGKLVYVGHVGGGFDEKMLERMYNQLKPLVQKNCPFADRPETNTPVTWVQPKLLAEVTFSHWTTDGRMRHPVFLGFREDKNAKDVAAERYFTLTNLSKVFWPKEGYTKGDLIQYYREISSIILPYLKNRPQSLLRYPNGITGKSFYQKDASLLDADWIETISIYSDSNKKNIDYLLCQDEATLVYLINLGCIDLNPWSSRVGKLEYPDYLLIDLDPEETDFKKVVQTALACRSVLEKLDIPGFVKTSGAKGMHIYIPLRAQYTYEQSRKLAELLCMQVHNTIPDITSMKRKPEDRKGLVYLDYLQNIKGQTLASVYSVRPQTAAPVSTPLLWSEVTEKLHPSQFTIKNVPDRIQKHGDLFTGVLGKGIDMMKVLQKMSTLT